jgi:starch synthase
MSGPRVLMVASEAYPLAKTGGLGDCVSALAEALASEGCDVRLLLPAYPSALEQLQGRVRRIPLEGLPRQNTSLVCGEMPVSRLPVWLVDCPELYQRPGGPYQDEDGADWKDNAERFAMLVRTGAQLALARGPFAWRPDIVHLHDWPAGPIAAILAQEAEKRPATVFTIHNLAFQGLFDPAVLHTLGLPRELLIPDGLEFWGRVSFLKAGIRYADRVTTVSETYAREILTPSFGCGLNGALGARSDSVIGIRNGIDKTIWNPATDRLLPSTFDRHDLRGKAVCRSALRSRFGLAGEDAAPVVAYLCRMTEQKMGDVVAAALPDLVSRGVQIVAMGRGDKRIEDALVAAARHLPGHVGVITGYEEPPAHHMLAGADMLLAPARFEPCGLTQMYAMNYGTVPIASRVGGLAETIVDTRPDATGAGGETGFLIDDASPAGLLAAVDRALAHYRQPFLWRKLVVNGMRADFSWKRPAERYLAVYSALEPAQVRREALVPKRMRSKLVLRPVGTVSQPREAPPIPSSISEHAQSVGLARQRARIT